MLNFLSRFEFMFWVGGETVCRNARAWARLSGGSIFAPPNFLAPEWLNIDFTSNAVKSVLPQAGPDPKGSPFLTVRGLVYV